MCGWIPTGSHQYTYISTYIHTYHTLQLNTEGRYECKKCGARTTERLQRTCRPSTRSSKQAVASIQRKQMNSVEHGKQLHITGTKRGSIGNQPNA